jgi:GLPGLI family protein
MRYILLFGLFTAMQLNLHAQEDMVKIKYNETVFFTPNPNMPPQMLQNMPKSRELKKILIATESKANYIVNKEDPDPVASDQNGRRFGRNINEIIYQDLDEELKLTYTDLFGKEFLISDTIKTKPWKLHSGEQREILGYTCVKAAYKRDSTVITAWYTAQLSPSFGPGGYAGLPGTILALTEGENKVFLATHIEKNPTVNNVIEKPTKGEAVGRREYEKLAEEKRKEMQKMFSNRQGGFQGSPAPIR